MDKKELDFYVTKRLLEFYDGLIEREQISAPTRKSTQENETSNHCTAGCMPSQDPLRSEDDL